MNDPRSLLTIAIIAIVVYAYFGIWAVFWCVITGALIALIAFIYIVLRGEGKIKLIVQWFKNAWKFYLKTEAKFFKWIDSL